MLVTSIKIETRESQQQKYKLLVICVFTNIYLIRCRKDSDIQVKARYFYSIIYNNYFHFCFHYLKHSNRYPEYMLKQY
jgi:hypothetical protein